MAWAVNLIAGAIQIPRLNLAGDFAIKIVAAMPSGARFFFGGDTAAGSLEIYRNNGGVVALYIATAGIFSGVTPLSNNITAPDTIEVTRTGSAITVLVNGITQGSTTFAGTMNITYLGMREGWQFPVHLRLFLAEFTDIATPANSRTYDPTLTGGTGAQLATRQGGNYGTQIGAWPSDDTEWTFYQGTAAPSDPLHSLFRRGESPRLRTRDLIPVDNVYPIARTFFELPEPEPPSGTTWTGGGAVSFTVNVVGGGTVSRIGGGPLAIVAPIVGGGTVSRIGGGPLPITMPIAGGGAVNRPGGGALTFTIPIAGGGTVSRIGGGSLPITMPITGGGGLAFAGGAGVSFSFTSAGAGLTVQRSGGSVSISLLVSGGGALGFAGGGPVDFSAAIAGGGSTGFAGGGPLPLEFVIVGGGEVLGPGYRPTIRTPQIVIGGDIRAAVATVARDRRVVAATVSKTTTAEPVRVARIVRAPYTATVRKTFRAEPCKL